MTVLNTTPARPPGNAIVRPGGPEDSEAAVQVWRLSNSARRAGRPNPPGHEERVRGSTRKPDAILFVADDQGAIVGMALAMQGLADDGAGPPIPGLCFLSMVFVLPDHWGRGIGVNLVRAILSGAHARGYDRVQLWTHADNRRAQRLYERLGFLRAGREKDDDTGARIVLYERAVEPDPDTASTSQFGSAVR
jgi:ribosomal protein S18 acetylase RimI-like enzyme